MSALHTPEPWKLSKDYYFDRFIHGGYGETRIGTLVGSQHEENAKRIIACVNACAGTTTDDLNRIANFGGWEKVSITWKTDREQLERQHEAKLGEKIQLTQVLNARLEGMRIENDRLTQQRDELLDLLNVLRGWYRTPSKEVELAIKEHRLYPAMTGSEKHIWNAVDKAIAKVSEKRCEHCDGTGDVHSLDGEWRGECTMCDAAKAGEL